MVACIASTNNNKGVTSYKRHRFSSYTPPHARLGTNYHENWSISGQRVYPDTQHPIVWISRTGKSISLWAFAPNIQTDYDHLEHKLLLPRAQIPNFRLSDDCALLRKERYFLDAMRVCCAGLDVHQSMVVACIVKGPLECKSKIEIREFSTILSGLLALRDWLSEEGCTDVAMESTGVYWKPINNVDNVLESTCDITLGNARHIKNLLGRKTDVNDARWIVSRISNKNFSLTLYVNLISTHLLMALL